MIIKKFQAKTENEAIEAAKKELGENVVIMNVKNTKKKKFGGLFWSNTVEVTVALEEENERIPTNVNVKKDSSAIPKKKVSSTGSASPIVPDAIWEQGGKKDNFVQEDTGKAIVEKLNSLQILLEQQMKTYEKEDTKESITETVLKTENIGKKDNVSKEIMTFLKLLYNTMLENEVWDKYANQLIDEIEKNGNNNMQMDFALSMVYQKMILKFGQAELIKESTGGPKLIYFIGPTGVGKTTTIAKIASKFSVEQKKKIALLTADTYRIAAAEQLRTYANILEVPFRVIYTPEEIEQALDDFRTYDYILVDTSGHSHQNEEQKEATKEFIRIVNENVEKEVFLVLSATTKYRDLTGIADSYKDITDFKLIFTKLDETTALGNLYNLRLYTGAPLSYVTWGQNVPDDISPFNPQSTVKKILSNT